MTNFHVLCILKANGSLFVDGQTGLSERAHGRAHEPGEGAIQFSNVHNVGWWILQTKGGRDLFPRAHESSYSINKMRIQEYGTGEHFENTLQSNED